MENLVGKNLGKYQVIEEIGRGAMGAVFKGYDPTLDRQVAIKVLAPHLIWDPQFVERFLREARVAARLRHPNIVTIFDVGQKGKRCYFVMEYLEGETLRDYIRRHGPLPPEDVLSIAQQLAGALDHAHQQGVVHRDVKPGNIIIGPDGHVTLTDFGIVKAATETHLTATGLTLGTPEYMAPEQAATGQVTPASDLYALGVITYEMLSGQVPFQADSTVALLYRIVHEPPPSICLQRPDLPDEVNRVVARALSKSPQARYPTGAAFVADLELALAGQPTALPLETPTTVLELIEVQASSPPPAAPRTGQGPAPSRGQPGYGPRARSAAIQQPARRQLPPWVWALAGSLFTAGVAAVVVVTVVLARPPQNPFPTAVPFTQVAGVASVVTSVVVVPTPAPTVATETPTTTPTPTRAPTRAPTRTPTPGIEVVNEAANVRSGPGTEYGRIAQLKRGDRVTVVAYARGGDGGKWFLIALADGRRGWISASLVQENSAVAQVPRAATIPPTPIPPTKTPPPPTSIPTSPPEKTYWVTIAANSGCWYVYNNIFIQQGELVTLSASGTWDFGGCARVCKVCPVGPDGCSYSMRELEMPGKPMGALIARVDNGNPVVAGSYYRWRADKPGNLKMCMNDTPGFYYDNTGYLSVQVTISP